MSPLTLDRAIARILNGPGSATRAALLATGKGGGVYRLKTGLKPAAWPHVIYEKIPAGVRRVHAGVPRLVGDVVRVVATVRSDLLLPGQSALETLEPIATAILADLSEARCTETATGRVFQSHIRDPRYERDYAAGEDSGVSIQEMGVEVVFLSS